MTICDNFKGDIYKDFRVRVIFRQLMLVIICNFFQNFVCLGGFRGPDIHTEVISHHTRKFKERYIYDENISVRFIPIYVGGCVCVCVRACVCIMSCRVQYTSMV